MRLPKWIDIFRRGRKVEDPEHWSTARRGATPLWLTYSSDGLAVATVYRCVKLLSESVANLPLMYKRRNNAGIFEQWHDNLWYLLNVQPDIAMSAFDMWARVVSDMLLYGNAYIVPIYSVESMAVGRLAIVAPWCVRHDTMADTYYVSDPEAGVFYPSLHEDEIIHIKGLGRNPKHGQSVISYARQTVDIASAGEGETLNRFSNGGMVRAIVTNEKKPQGYGVHTVEQLQELAEDLDERFQTSRIVGVKGAVDVKVLNQSAADMQFLESRRLAVRDICRFFGVHPSFVFDDTSNNYKSAEMANMAFLSNTLNPILRKIENELQRKLIPADTAYYRKFEFDRRGLYACDLESRVKYQTQLIGAGLATVNELRKDEDKPPVEGGDKVLVSANLKGIEDLVNDNKNQKDEE